MGVIIPVLIMEGILSLQGGGAVLDHGPMPLMHLVLK